MFRLKNIPLRARKYPIWRQNHNNFSQKSRTSGHTSYGQFWACSSTEVEPAVYFRDADNDYQKLHFLDITVILHKNKKVETDIFCKDTNTRDYLNYNSDHPLHIKNNSDLTQDDVVEEDVVENNRIINHASWENPFLQRLLLRRDHFTDFYHVLE